MGNLNKLAKRCLRKGESYAKRNKEKEVRISHVILGILNDPKRNFVLSILEELNVDVDMLMESIMIIKNELVVKSNGSKPYHSEELVNIIVYAKENMLILNDKAESSVEDLFFATMHTHNELSQLFLDFAVEPITFKETAEELDESMDISAFGNLELYDYVDEIPTIKVSNNNNEVLDKYCVNVNQQAIEKEVSPCFGRKKEMEQLYRILSRTRKSNAILIGKAGVGKTNIVEGFAVNIVNGEVPEHLKTKVIYSLNLNSVIAGTKYRGQFEERVQGILDELTLNKNVVLFIDEIHTIMGAGNAEGSMDLSNILKPYIARKGFQVIGATTTKEYKKYIEKNKALQRRFAEIQIDEPSLEVCIKILNKLKAGFEEAHSVQYSPEAITACVELSDKYITYRSLPDKAIDLLDDVAVKLRLNDTINSQLSKLQSQFKENEELKKLIISTKAYHDAEATNKESNKILLHIRREKSKMKKELRTALVVTEADVKSVVQEMTNIPLDEKGIDVKNLKKVLQSKIIGQDEAIDDIVKTLMINKLQLGDEDKPIGSFMFVGYSGVGKTQLTRELTTALLGNEKNLIRFDCSEYGQAFEVSKLIGAPSGYVGYEEGGILTEAVRRNPFSVILFDEIEKAHDKLFDILLQILGEGRLTNNQGETINFKNTIVILTSNIGTKRAAITKVGFGKTEDIQTGEIDKALKKRFRPEFINRLDNIIHFNVFSKTDLMLILNLELNKLQKQVEKHGCTLKISSKVKSLLVDEANIPENGARALKRKINDNVKLLVAEQIIEGKKEISLVIKNKEISVK